MSEEMNTWLKFASMNRKAGRQSQAKRTLVRLLEYDPSEVSAGQEGFGAGSGRPLVMFAYCKHLWGVNSREEAFQRLQSLASELFAASYQREMEGRRLAKDDAKLVSKTFLKLGQWRWQLAEETLDDDTISDVLTSFGTATKHSRHWAKAWHNWALFNATAMEHYQRLATQQLNVNEERDALKAAATRHVAPAVSGFFRSIALGGSTPRDMGGALQDILRLLTLWFNYGHLPEVEAALVEGFGHVSINTWLSVIPQIVARIHTNSSPVRRLIHRLLVRVGRQHPQALLYPLLVACKSQSTTRRVSATAVLDNLRNHSALLVEQAEVVSLELIRVAIVWHEAWHEALEEASRLYFGEQNVDGMLAVLAPLHHILERTGAETLQEMSFAQAYGRELREAREYCEKFKESGREEDLNQAWDLYYHVFKRINKQLPTLTNLELRYVSHRLLSARDLELSLPGNYIAGGEVVTIAWFAPTMHVITSKQRPRRLQIHGSDGKDYGYLLKGHEDLRQDERVMQLFGLVNQLLNSTPSTSRKDLAIARYAVVPLSPNSGLIGWVPNCDTMHVLIREHREARKIPLNLEHRLMLAMAPDYDNLPLVNKVEVFRHALDNTPGNDLAQVLWLKSHSSEQWLDRRTTYTRSLAVMSMVGYLLGLGDRHPSNLMIDRYSGKVLHIDFGDCFEASMHREKFPERVPFRLTRMLVKAMEVAGIEGNFIGTCQRVVTVLRSNKDSVLAMLEAFVHDPLINWRLLANQTTVQNESSAEPSNANSAANNSGSVTPAAETSSAKSSPLARRTISHDDGERTNSNKNDDLATGDGSSGSGSTTPAGSDMPSGQSSRGTSRTPPPKTPTIPENESFHDDLDQKSKKIGIDSRVNTADIAHNSSSRLDSGSDDLPRTGQKPGAAPMFMDTPSGQVPVSSSVMGATALHAQYENMREFGGGGGTTAVIDADINVLGGVDDPTNVSIDESEHGGGNVGGQDRSGVGNQQQLHQHSSSYARRVMHQQLGGGETEQHHKKIVSATISGANDDSSISSFEPEILKRDELIDALDGMNDNEDNIVLNDRAVSVMQRMNDKLNGKDGLIESGSAVDTGDSVEHQVRRLIEKAMNHENLCTSYIGWCSFW
jgi:phosphatidylinositol kinase/protein kinase (PI-3  family)